MQQRLIEAVHQTLTTYPGAWLVWCDPRGDWLPLLERAAASPTDGFTLLALTDETAGHFGGPQARQQLQQQLDAGQSFVLVVPRPANDLGWLWAQALLAERIVDRPLRDKLRDWGWRSVSLTLSDDEVATLARLHLHEDPAEWGGGGLQADPALLLEALAGARPTPEQRLLLDLTVEQAGLPVLDEANLPGWRNRCLAHLLVSEAHDLAPALVPEDHTLLVAPAGRPLALHLLRQWADSVRLSQRLPDAVIEADKIAGLGSLLAAAPPEHGPFLSQVAEQAIFAAACGRLAQQNGQALLAGLADLHEAIERHAQGFWGHRVVHARAIPWDELDRLSQAARTLLEAAATLPWPTPQAAIDWYTSDGWRLDQAGLEIMRDLAHPTPELLALIAPLRAAYRARWEQHMIEWSAVWAGAGCPTPPLPSAGDWLAGVLSHPRPTAILVIDALRYDLGCLLAERVNHQEAASRAHVTPARAPLPSITALGMALALPIPEHELRADLVEGRWQISRQGQPDNLSVAERRRAWWQAQGGVPANGLLDMATVQAGNAPQPTPQLTRLVIHDAAIDKLGHDDQLEVEGGGFALHRYLRAVERLRDAGWLRILVVTDHGFIHWPSSSERNAPYPAPDPAYASRRGLAYPAQQALSGPQSLAPGGQWRVAVPHGAASFRAYGGLGYFHGGASLQEWIIPCVAVQWPLEARPVQVEIEPLGQVLSQRPSITLNVVPASLLIEEALPRQVEVLIRHAQTRAILFRSPPQTVTPDQLQVPLRLAAVEGIAAERGTDLQVEVRDARTEDTLHQVASTLMIELTGW
jgi:hypothetical protein